MGTRLEHTFGVGIGVRKVFLRDKNILDSLSPSESSVTAAATQDRISPPATPDVMSSAQSRQTSTERASEVAPEIVVWTGEMDVDSPSPVRSDDLSSIGAKTE